MALAPPQAMTSSLWRISRLPRIRTIPRRRSSTGAAIGLILLVAFAIAFLIDEPLRRYTEAKKMNRALKGYTVHLKKLDLSVRIDDVDMVSMNDLFRAYGKFDVAEGRFFYSELSIHDGAIEGYVKPFFKDKSFAKKMYERVVGGVSRILQDRPREEVASKTDISGPLENPKVGTVHAIVKLIQNAFFKAILPGFDRETGRSGRPTAAGKGA